MKKTEAVQTEKTSNLRLDFAAVCLGAGLFVYFLLTADRGIAISDEAFYYTVPQRLLQGDLLLVHEWGVQQLPFLFLVIPYYVYVSVVGTTEGILLFSRYFFLVIDILFYAYMYKKLRHFKLAGLVCAFLFCAILPPSGLSLTYYSIAPMAMMTVCLTLFTGSEKKRLPSLTFSGVILAMAILAEPLLIFVYILFAAATVIRTLMKCDTGSAWLNLKWLFSITAGSFAVFCAFMIYLAVSGSLALLPQTIGYLLSSKGYTPYDIIEPARLKFALGLFGYGFLPCGVFLSVAAFWYSRQRKKNKKIKIIIFIISCLMFAACYVHAAVLTLSNTAYRNFDFLVNNGVPVLLFSPVWYFLLNKRDARLFPVWLIGFFSSLLMDISSDVILGSCGGIAQVTGLISFASLCQELRSDLDEVKHDRKAIRFNKLFSKILLPSVIVCVLSFSLWNAGFIYAEEYWDLVETIYGAGEGEPLSAELEKGPCKGLKTTERISGIYNALLQDLDTISAAYTGEPVYIDGLCPYGYLYLDLPYGVETAFFVPYDRRTGEYLTVFPEKRAKIIYFPMYDFDEFCLRTDMTKDDIPKVMSFIFGESRYELTETAAGFIVELV
ncbi:MAG: hypothetical protein J1E34_01640 [Oscillospiraceae bacterium]|nr:hypothetical protein [Oscillospiraceae bacterium]